MQRLPRRLVVTACLVMVPAIARAQAWVEPAEAIDAADPLAGLSGRPGVEQGSVRVEGERLVLQLPGVAAGSALDLAALDTGRAPACAGDGATPASLDEPELALGWWLFPTRPAIGLELTRAEPLLWSWDAQGACWRRIVELGLPAVTWQPQPVMACSMAQACGDEAERIQGCDRIELELLGASGKEWLEMTGETGDRLEILAADGDEPLAEVSLLEPVGEWCDERTLELAAGRDASGRPVLQIAQRGSGAGGDGSDFAKERTTTWRGGADALEPLGMSSHLGGEGHDPPSHTDYDRSLEAWYLPAGVLVLRTSRDLGYSATYDERRLQDETVCQTEVTTHERDDKTTWSLASAQGELSTWFDASRERLLAQRDLGTRRDTVAASCTHDEAAPVVADLRAAWPREGRFVYRVRRSGRSDDEAAVLEYDLVREVVSASEQADGTLRVELEERGGPADQAKRTVVFAVDERCVRKLGRKDRVEYEACLDGASATGDRYPLGDVLGAGGIALAPKDPDALSLAHLDPRLGLVATREQDAKGRAVETVLTAARSGQVSAGEHDAAALRCDWDASEPVAKDGTVSFALSGKAGFAQLSAQNAADGATVTLSAVKAGGEPHLTRAEPLRRARSWAAPDGTELVVLHHADAAHERLRILRLRDGAAVERQDFLFAVPASGTLEVVMGAHAGPGDASQCTVQMVHRDGDASRVATFGLEPQSGRLVQVDGGLSPVP